MKVSIVPSAVDCIDVRRSRVVPSSLTQRDGAASFAKDGAHGSTIGPSSAAPPPTAANIPAVVPAKPLNNSPSTGLAASADAAG